MVEIPVQLHLELEVNLLVRNVIEREIEREKVQMKPPKVSQAAAGRNLWIDPCKYPRKYPKHHVRQWAIFAAF